MGRRTKLENMGIEQLKNTFQGKRVLVTGHTGFKGAWFLLLLKELGAIVKGYALAPTRENDLFHLINGASLCESVIDDIRNQERLTQEVVSFEPDFIYHMAAQALVLESYETPVETYETNVMGTVYLLNAVKQLKKPCKTIVITTDKVYENLERLAPYKEDERLGGYDPYSNSKACAELAVSSFRNSFFNPSDFPHHQQSIATVRSGNVIGGGDWAEFRIIPDLAKSLENNQPLFLRNPHSVRPWQHVLDPLIGYLTLGAKMNEKPVEYATAFNFGPEDEDTLTVEELVKTAIAQWGSGTYEVAQNMEQPHEAHLLRLSISKAKTLLDWQPIFKSREAIAYTIDWYKNYQKDAAAYTLMQVKNVLSQL